MCFSLCQVLYAGFFVGMNRACLSAITSQNLKLLMLSLLCACASLPYDKHQ